MTLSGCIDYATIAQGLHFRRGRKIVVHENVLYFGDLNYRISLPNDEVRHLTHVDDYSTLISGDQLTTYLHNETVFAGYSEGPLIFRPTYKYDNGSDLYDTSEKQRVPSWTDRILYKGHGLDLMRYSRAEVMMSDHRPGEYVMLMRGAKLNLYESVCPLPSQRARYRSLEKRYHCKRAATNSISCEEEEVENQRRI